MWRSMTFVACFVMMALAASSREGAAAYALPGATEVRALLRDGGGENSESATLLVMGVALLGAAWAARRHTHTS